jgi:hypothetical protein
MTMNDEPQQVPLDHTAFDIKNVMREAAGPLPVGEVTTTTSEPKYVTVPLEETNLGTGPRVVTPRSPGKTVAFTAEQLAGMAPAASVNKQPVLKPTKAQMRQAIAKAAADNPTNKNLKRMAKKNRKEDRQADPKLRWRT